MDNTEKKKNNVWIYTLLIIIILGLVGYICYDKFWPGLVNNTENKEVNVEVKNDEKKISSIDLSLDSDLVTDARRIRYAYCGTEYYRFDGTSRKVSDLNADEKMYILVDSFYSGINVYNDFEEARVYNEKDAKKYFDDTSFLSAVSNKEYSKQYRKMKYAGGKFEVTDVTTGCEGPSDGVELHLSSVSKTGDKVSVIYNYLYAKSVDADTDKGYDQLYYKSKDAQTYIAKNPEYDDSKGDIKIDWSKADKYEFVYDVSNGNLKIQEINYIAAK